MANDITPEQLIDLFREHATDVGYVNEDCGTDNVCIDGWFNLEKIVEALNARAG